VVRCAKEHGLLLQRYLRFAPLKDLIGDVARLFAFVRDVDDARSLIRLALAP
jgi:hypothetical protein